MGASSEGHSAVITSPPDEGGHNARGLVITGRFERVTRHTARGDGGLAQASLCPRLRPGVVFEAVGAHDEEVLASRAAATGGDAR